MLCHDISIWRQTSISWHSVPSLDPNTISIIFTTFVMRTLHASLHNKNELNPLNCDRRIGRTIPRKSGHVRQHYDLIRTYPPCVSEQPRHFFSLTQTKSQPDALLWQVSRPPTYNGLKPWPPGLRVQEHEFFTGGSNLKPIRVAFHAT